MINQEDMNFLLNVRDYVSKHPDVASYVAQYASFGVGDAMSEARRRANDMETVAFMAMSKKIKPDHPFMQETISAWEGKTSLNWLAWEKLLKLKAETAMEAI